MVLLNSTHWNIFLFELFFEGNSCLHWLANGDRDDIAILQLIMKHIRRVNNESEINMDALTHFKKFIDQINNEKQTALMIAAMNNRQNLVKSLLDYGADIDLVDKNGMKATNYAKQNSCGLILNSYLKVKTQTNKNSLDYLNRPNSDALDRIKESVENSE